MASLLQGLLSMLYEVTVLLHDDVVDAGPTQGAATVPAAAAFASRVLSAGGAASR